jgi:hypothetical protein
MYYYIKIKFEVEKISNNKGHLLEIKCKRKKKKNVTFQNKISEIYIKQMK